MGSRSKRSRDCTCRCSDGAKRHAAESCAFRSTRAHTSQRLLAEINGLAVFMTEVGFVWTKKDPTSNTLTKKKKKNKRVSAELVGFLYWAS